jgi:hypothetical protein
MKNNQKIILKLVAVILFLTIAIITVPAQSGSGNLRRVGNAEFEFYSLQDPLLFPETAFEVNPAVLRRLNKKFLLFDSDLSLESSSTTAERLDDSIGSKGGTYTQLSQDFTPSAALGYLSPLSKAKRRPILGAVLDFDMTYDLEQQEYIDYQAFSENVVNRQLDTPLTVGSDFFFASTLGKGFWGASAGYAFNYIPALFRTVTDASLPDDGTYVDNTVREYDIFSHNAAASLGTVFPISRAAEISVAVNYDGAFTDRKKEYIAIDKDGDGNNETVMEYGTYVFFEGAGGPATLAESYDAKDLTISNQVTLHPSMRLYVADKVELFFGGEYTVLDLDHRTSYQRIRLVGDPEEEDESIKYDTFNSSFTSFDVLGGLAVRVGANSLMKMGIGYLRDDQRFSQDGRTAAGGLLYNRENTGNYTELSLGLEPANNSIIGNVENSSKDLTHSLILRIGLENKPKSGLQTFFAFDLTASRNKAVYYAYNLDTRSVWYEESVTEGILWELSPVAGIAFPVGKNGAWSVSLKGTGSFGDPERTTETAPFDESQQKATTDGSIDLAKTADFNFEVKIGFVLMF